MQVWVALFHYVSLLLLLLLSFVCSLYFLYFTVCVLFNEHNRRVMIQSNADELRDLMASSVGADDPAVLERGIETMLVRMGYNPRACDSDSLSLGMGSDDDEQAAASAATGTETEETQKQQQHQQQGNSEKGGGVDKKKKGKGQAAASAATGTETEETQKQQQQQQGNSEKGGGGDKKGKEQAATDSDTETENETEIDVGKGGAGSSSRSSSGRRGNLRSILSKKALALCEWQEGKSRVKKSTQSVECYESIVENPFLG
jgi:hypothetical protein